MAEKRGEGALGGRAELQGLSRSYYATKRKGKRQSRLYRECTHRWSQAELLPRAEEQAQGQGQRGQACREERREQLSL